MKPWIKYVGSFVIFFVIGFVSFTVYNFLTTKVFGEGVSIELKGESVVEGNVSRLKVFDGGYFKGSLVDLVTSEYDGPSPYKSYLVLGAELTGAGNEALEFSGIRVEDKEGNVVGNSFPVYTNEDNLTEYTTDSELLKKYKLMGTGDKLYPEMSITGVVYVETDKLKSGEEYRLVVGGAEEGDGIAFTIGDEEFDESDVLAIDVGNKDVKTDLKVGELSKGSSIVVTDQEVKTDAVSFGLVDGVLYREVAEDFHYGIGHLTSFNGTEDVLLVNVKFKNVSGKDLIMGKFIIERPDGSVIDVVRVAASEDVGNGRLPVDTMEEYGLLSYHGVKNGEVPLEKGKEIGGRLIVHSNDLVKGERLVLKYVDVSGKTSEGLPLTLMN